MGAVGCYLTGLALTLLIEEDLEQDAKNADGDKKANEEKKEAKKGSVECKVHKLKIFRSLGRLPE